MPSIRSALRAVTLLAASLLASSACGTGRAAADPGASAIAGSSASPTQAVASLLTADRDFAARAASVDVIAAIGAMLADDAIMPTPDGRWARGRADIAGVLASNPANRTSRLAWTPIRGGVSADGTHGFTYGYVTVGRADGSRQEGKYMAYWIRGDAGWRVAAYKRVPRLDGPVSTAERPPALPPAARPPADAATRARWAAELRDAELAFSREAQTGLARAFRDRAAPDAANMGGPVDTAFVFGPEAIAASVAAGGEPPPGALTWGPDTVIVAPTGDLGISIGFIAFQAPPGTAGEARRRPFFTIWRRDGPDAPWRFVAE